MQALCGATPTPLPGISYAPPRGPLLRQFVKEPIEQWQNVGGSAVNLLDLFYRDPTRMAYTFQNFVFLTRVLQVGPAVLPDVRVRVCPWA